MTTEQIKILANLDDVGNDLDLDLMLRTVVIQEFMADVGDVRWRRRNTTLAIAPGDSWLGLETDFHSMRDIKIPKVGSATLKPEDSLKYIGEDTNAVLLAEACTTRARPTGFYIAPKSVSGASTGAYQAIRFNCPSDATYTAYYSYLLVPVFADDEAIVDMDRYIPTLYQGGLVKCLRKAILVDRVGQSDPRYQEALGEYRTWLGKRITPDLARRNFISTVN